MRWRAGRCGSPKSNASAQQNAAGWHTIREAAKNEGREAWSRRGGAQESGGSRRQQQQGDVEGRLLRRADTTYNNPSENRPTMVIYSSGVTRRVGS